jgi:hypothetical protein
MAASMTLDAMVSQLEAQIAFEREREAFHAAQEAYHREQRAVYVADLEKLTTTLEALKAAAAVSAELAARARYTPPPPSLDIGRKASLTRMIRHIIAARPAGDVFGTNIITAEVNRHYRERLRRPVKEKLVSITLRRMLNQGELRSVRPGKPHHEALYARVEEEPVTS